MESPMDLKIEMAFSFISIALLCLTGIILTKLDGTAKGGIVVAIAKELGVHVKLVGVGEGLDDLKPFDAREYVEAII